MVGVPRPDDPPEDDPRGAARPRRVLAAPALAYFDRLWSAADGPPERFEPRRDFLLAQLREGERILDLGCGLGDFSGLLAQRGFEVVGADVSQEALRRARARFPAVEFALSGAELPFADGEFDAVWLSEVLEHVQDGLGLLAEVRRTLAPDGRLLLTTPDHGFLTRLHAGLSRRAFERAFDPCSDHVRFFTAGSLRATLDAAGLPAVAIARSDGLLLAHTIRA
ncbi:MAG TPA: class I SAM-dependent methyltransferase [Solirubrobacteraceae bacterium]|nr:class I SAM-dependent methyltransferase [Solirubrobacteraceae bacterium]